VSSKYNVIFIHFFRVINYTFKFTSSGTYEIKTYLWPIDNVLYFTIMLELQGDTSKWLDLSYFWESVKFYLWHVKYNILPLFLLSVYCTNVFKLNNFNNNITIKSSEFFKHNVPTAYFYLEKIVAKKRTNYLFEIMATKPM